MFASDNDPVAASEKLQAGLNDLEKWTRQWRIMMNRGRIRVTFTNRRDTWLPVDLNDLIPHRKIKFVTWSGDLIAVLRGRNTLRSVKVNKEININLGKMYSGF